MATILTKKKDTTGAPSAGDLTNSSGGAELAVNTADKRLYTKDSGGNVVEVGINPTSITTGTLNTSGAVVFNDAGADVDFRVEGDTDANLLFVDASTDRVGIGTNAPGAILHVNGTQYVQSSSNYLIFWQQHRVLSDSMGIESQTTGGLEIGTNSTQPLALYTNATERVRITSGGNFLVGGTTNPLSTTAAIHGSLTVGADQSAAIIYFDDATFTTSRYRLLNSDIVEGDFGIQKYDGSAFQYAVYINSNREVITGGTTDNGAYNLQCNGTGVWGAGAYVNGSDERLKDNITSIDSGLDVVTAMRPVTFTYKEDYSKDQSIQTGFIAQELQQAMNGKNYVDGIVQAGPEYLNVAYQNLIPILTKAIQELKAELDIVKAELATLKGQ